MADRNIFIKISGRFIYLLIFIEEYSRYIVRHALLKSMDADSVSFEARTAIDILRKLSLAEPVIQSDNGSSFISRGSRSYLTRIISLKN